MVKKCKDIYTKSNELHTNIRKKGKNGISSKWAYYFCKSILNGKKDVKTVTQSDAPNATGVAINQKLSKAEYTEVMKRYVKWVEKNKAVPNYITVKGKKVKPRIWTAYVGYLFKVYYETGKLPASQPIKSDIYKTTTSSDNNCSNPYKSSPHPTKRGCDGMGQNTGYFCADAAMQHSLHKFGISVSQSQLAKWAGTTTSGTSHEGIRTAIAMVNKKFGVNITVQEKNFSDLGIAGLAKLICQKNVDAIIHLLYRLKWGHYESINEINVKTNMLKILNSLGDSCSSGCYCGYVEDRSLAVEKSYISGISQKSVIILTKK